MSLTERLFTGVMVMLIQKLAPDVSTKSNTLSEYFRWVLVFGCGGSAICALIVTLILCTMTLGERLKDCQMENPTFFQRKSTEKISNLKRCTRELK